MDKEKKVGFLLTPDLQDQVIKIAQDLEQKGVVITNEVFMGIIEQLHSKGKVLKAEGNQIQEMIGKIVPDGGKVLHIKSEEKHVPSGNARSNKTGFMGRLQRKLVRVFNILFMDNT